MTVQQNEYLSRQQLILLAKKALGAYANEYQGEISLLCQSENATFLVKTPSQRFALRIHRPNYHSYIQIESELNWLDALREHGIAVPQAIECQQGKRVQTMIVDQDTVRYGVLFHWIEGTMPTVTSIDPQDFKQLGQITAQLHQHSQTWIKPDHFDRIVWNHDTMLMPNGHWGDWRHAPHLKMDDCNIVDEAITQIADQLDAFGKSADRYGLIHADLRLTNLLFNKHKVGVIDFDDCGMSWYLHDLAAAMSFNEHYAAAPFWMDEWLNGYEKNNHITQQEFAIIPSLLMQRRIQLMAWVGSHAYTEMARSLGEQWTQESIRLCKKYLNNQIPIGI
ncbi:MULTISPECIES: phosphotransferase enzyme family protein [unclassified Acinetobacter]|uniref:phosphotransferase enzyme family protein n=1 Tax=unclassified Acinetobacter TaxID=196816 RepID=UPI00293463C1|nr:MULTISPECIES: phosphotransferase [unclassified Acinetobacter]WOE32900.1 phosphotransferase [Acinetobacter sp. SAAs470]WOE38377.1 phosphotransferase [Acinetobacter sp. SAAs474]